MKTMKSIPKKDLTAKEYIQGVLQKNRAILGRAITLIESEHKAHQKMALQVIEGLLPHSGKSLRIGISGIPGVGKSTFIESLGTRLIGHGHQLAVLAVDPSSSVTGGSILGDKTRMEKLSQDLSCFIRPSPNSGTLGGVTQKTKETILLCEAFGFDRILVETVGVGQSETMVADMVDLFVVMLLPGAGDELQGIKRGILEMADMIVIHKADGENLVKARAAKSEFERALRILKGEGEGEFSRPPVLTCSSLTLEGLDEVVQTLELLAEKKFGRQGIIQKRMAQQKKWMWWLIESSLKRDLKNHPKLKILLRDLSEEVVTGKTSPQMAAKTIVEQFYQLN